jgi:hypothetical protein
MFRFSCAPNSYTGDSLVIVTVKLWKKWGKPAVSSTIQHLRVEIMLRVFETCVVLRKFLYKYYKLRSKSLFFIGFHNFVKSYVATASPKSLSAYLS